MGMKHEQRVAAGLAVAAVLTVVGCGSVRPAQPRAAIVIAHGVTVREPVVDPRPYGAADTVFGLDVLGAWCASDPGANLVLSPSSLDRKSVV